MSVKYDVDARSSRFVAKVRATGVLGAFGHNPTIAIRKFSGSLEFDVNHPQSASFQLIVSVDSMEVMDDISKKDRQEIERQLQTEVLETRKYGEIRFQSRAISAEKAGENAYQLKMMGDLSLHGVTKSECIEGRVRIRDDEVRITGGFSLLQSDYQIKRITALAGAIKVRDELSFEFDIAGVRVQL
jgi:polyisoprenoid-binding protein YceI